eukprot:gnl/Dysnectes_brevis/1755_a2002_2372.p1 GENE.gnl/Dysnectes_brevis/1755_a2002_2372~~gnl/Dysnectes_brevis/1755_a2002_2372.p1  ORF type:complete len:199 (+),score=17.39 gnl/Dysnectes_brevis/1755_a2002_2372:89-685(+)
MISHSFLTLSGGKKSVISKDGLQKIHTSFEDGTESVEEFDMKTQLCVIRKWKRRNAFGAVSTTWDYEIGMDPSSDNQVVSGLYMSSSTPTVMRHELDEFYTFRISNMPWPEDNYHVSVDNDQIVVRTKNKKFFKRLSIPDLQRVKIPMVSALLRVRHQRNSLVIFYRKPPQIMMLEQKAKAQRMKGGQKDGDVQCPVQ